jgi:hypothetical protein
VGAVSGRFRIGFGDDFEDSVDFMEFLWCRGVLDPDDLEDVDDSDEFAEHLDNREW